MSEINSLSQQISFNLRVTPSLTLVGICLAETALVSLVLLIEATLQLNL